MVEIGKNLINPGLLKLEQKAQTQLDPNAEKITEGNNNLVEPKIMSSGNSQPNDSTGRPTITIPKPKIPRDTTATNNTGTTEKNGNKYKFTFKRKKTTEPADTTKTQTAEPKK